MFILLLCSYTSMIFYVIHTYDIRSISDLHPYAMVYNDIVPFSVVSQGYCNNLWTLTACSSFKLGGQQWLFPWAYT